MTIQSHEINTIKIAEIISDTIIIQSAQDGLDLMGDIYYQGFDKVILYEKNMTPEFFDLKTKMMGEILQKFSNYRIGLAIVGDFSKYESKSMKDFIFESNRMRHVSFVASVEDALKNFSQ
ncbi:alpha/beta hydrolase [Chryseobacterium angstadtii]|uniref:Alpha/beta hydrolase n=1 Tax=Chryseobacterium angstadtii TaxID=558151 RepID=A0A0J7IFR1_9FLAO|nr:DUF4180 domain-containing protein [Chryseobacterium angstadtii]KMQ64859.1 alpha/beta hydrolase [Chryseobacterium angstadtii]